MTEYLLTVDSSNASNVYSQTKSFSDYLYNITQVSTLADQSYEIALVEALIPNNQFNVNSTNSGIAWQENNATGSVYSTNLTPGIYNASSLATTLETAMNSTGSIDFDVSYDSNSYIMSLSATGNFALLATSTIQGVLGFAPGTTSGITTSFAETQTGSYPVNILGSQYYDIVLSFPCNSFTTSALFGTVLDRVLMSVPTGQTQYIQYYNPRKIPIRAADLSTFQVRIYNDQGVLASISPNFAYVLKFLITPISSVRK